LVERNATSLYYHAADNNTVHDTVQTCCGLNCTQTKTATTKAENSQLTSVSSLVDL